MLSPGGLSSPKGEKQKPSRLVESEQPGLLTLGPLLSLHPWALPSLTRGLRSTFPSAPPPSDLWPETFPVTRGQGLTCASQDLDFLYLAQVPCYASEYTLHLIAGATQPVMLHVTAE